MYTLAICNDLYVYLMSNETSYGLKDQVRCWPILVVLNLIVEQVAVYNIYCQIR